MCSSQLGSLWSLPKEPDWSTRYPTGLIINVINDAADRSELTMRHIARVLEQLRVTDRVVAWDELSDYVRYCVDKHAGFAGACL